MYMPRAFNQTEQMAICDGLKAAGRQYFSAQGVVRTSVEQLTTAAGIAKGSFYKFYASKELLFFELLEESQNRIRSLYLSPSKKQAEKNRKSFEIITRKVFEEFCSDPFIHIMSKEHELLAITRKVPTGYLQRHQADDRAFIKELIDTWNAAPRPPSVDQIAACLTMLVLLGLKRDFVGERLLPHALESVVANLCDCFFVANHANN